MTNVRMAACATLAFLALAGLFMGPAAARQDGFEDGKLKLDAETRVARAFDRLGDAPFVKVGNNPFHKLYVLYSMQDSGAVELYDMIVDTEVPAEFRWIAFDAGYGGGDAAAWMAYARDRDSLRLLLRDEATAPKREGEPALQKAYRQVQAAIRRDFLPALFEAAGTSEGVWSPVVVYKTTTGEIRVFRGVPNQATLEKMAARAVW